MTGQIRFHLDENVDSAIADGLRRRGVDVTMPNDVGLIGASDEEQLAFALREHRAIFTHDDDFLALAHRGTEHWGIIYCHPQSMVSQRSRVCSYTLGHSQPGSYAPYRWYYPKPSLTGWGSRAKSY
jgi:predicted nuclease of predicted toxin-antitoxin system